MVKNESINCDVTKCSHNFNGCNCALSNIRITCCSDGSCTRCGNYQEKI